MSEPSALRPRAGSSAKSVLLTVLGELVLPRAGAAWTQTMVDTLGLLDVEEKNARQALLRVANQGFLVGERVGRRVRWELTPSGTELLTTGTARIYSFGGPSEPWDGTWLIVLCSVPEDHRAKRHQLRSRLSFAGFGFIAASTAVTPHVDREALANAVLQQLELVEGAAVFHGQLGALVPAEDLLHHAWDLEALGTRYREFIRSFQRRDPQTDEGRLADLVALVHEWRRFPFFDPEFPGELLPAGWAGHEAKSLFDELHDRWSSGARGAFAKLEAANG